MRVNADRSYVVIGWGLCYDSINNRLIQSDGIYPSSPLFLFSFLTRSSFFSFLVDTFSLSVYLTLHFPFSCFSLFLFFFPFSPLPLSPSLSILVVLCLVSSQRTTNEKVKLPHVTGAQALRSFCFEIHRTLNSAHTVKLQQQESHCRELMS